MALWVGGGVGVGFVIIGGEWGGWEGGGGRRGGEGGGGGERIKNVAYGRLILSLKSWTMDTNNNAILYPHSKRERELWPRPPSMIGFV